MKSTLAAIAVASLLIPSTPANAEPLCFMEWRNRVIDLGSMCGVVAPRVNIPSIGISSVVAPPVSSQAGRCSRGFKVTIAGACRSLSGALVNLSDFKVSKTSNQYLFDLTYTASNPIEVPVNLQFVYLQITANGATKSKIIQPSVTLQPNQSLQLKATLLDSDLSGAKPDQVSVTLDRIVARER